jgi:hypothetical protein
MESKRIEAINNQKVEYKEAFLRSASLKLHTKHRKLLRNNFKGS